MSDDLNYKLFKDYIQVSSSATQNAADETERQKLFWSRVADLCGRTGIDRVLVVSEMSGSLDTYAAYDIASAPESFGWSRSIKLAIVYRDEERFRSGKFSETVAVNRGYRFKAFQAEKEAIDWLLK